MTGPEKVSEAPPPPDVTSPPPRSGGNDSQGVPPARAYEEEKALEEVGRQRGTQVKKEEGRGRKPCTYVKGGICRLHGKGAVSKWRPVFKTVVEGGVTTKKKTKEYFWVCDVGNVGVRRQTVLSFVRTTPGDTIKTPDTAQGGVGGFSSVRATKD